MSNEKKSIFACIDGSSVSTAVCDYGAWMSQKMGADLSILHSLENDQTGAVTDLSGALSLGVKKDLLDSIASQEAEKSRLLMERSDEIVSGAKKHLLGRGISNARGVQRKGHLTEALIDLESEINLLIMGIRGEQHDRQEGGGVGTQLESVIRSMRQPILVVNKAFEEPKRTMLAYDGSDSCKKALDVVARNKAFAHIPCDVVHVGSDGEALLNEAVEKLKKAGIEAKGVQISGRMEEALPTYQTQNNIDVTLMGAFSHNRLRGLLLGSFTAKMLENTNRPLFLLR